MDDRPDFLHDDPLIAPATSSPAQNRVADEIARALHAAGIRHAFGMPGGEVIALIDALEIAGIRFVLMRQESGAAIAAAATSLTTGAPGLLVTTLGPGLGNAVNGIADAVQERMPLIVLSGVVDRAVRSRYTHQVLDHAALMRGAGVRSSFEIDGADAGAVVARAVALALGPVPGPVHIDLAPGVAATVLAGHETVARSDSAGCPVGMKRAAVAGTDAAADRLTGDGLTGAGLADDRFADGSPAIRAARSAGEAASAGNVSAIEAVRMQLAAAQRPLAIAGFEAARAGPTAAAALAALGAAGVPILTTYKGKGVVDERARFALGAAGLSPKADAILQPLVRAADLVLLAGYDPIEMRQGWLDPFGADADVIELTAAPADHGMHRAGTTIVGPLSALLRAVAVPVSPACASSTGGEHVADAEGFSRWANGEPASAREKLDEAFDPPAPWGPHAVIDAMQRALPSAAVMTVDSGAHRILFSQRWKAVAPLTVLQSAGWCTMGSALPLAIGVAVSEPGRPVVAVLGDGGLEMTLGELGTLRDAGLPVVVVVLQDASLALIELKQRQAGLAPAGVALGRTDLAAVAKAFGGHGTTVGDIAALDRALRLALAADAFSLIACTLDASDYAGQL